jgi:aminopeptidase
MLPHYSESLRRKLASSVLRGALRMKRGENLIVETWSATLPWAESLVLEARLLGVRPLLFLEDESTYWKSVALAPAPNLGQVGSHEYAALKEADAYVYLNGPLDTAREERRPPSLLRRALAVDHEWFRLARKYEVRTVRWDLGRTSELQARRYGVNLNRWRDELIQATVIDAQTIRGDARRVAAAFRRGSEVSVSHPNGTDLKLRLARRPPIVDDGVIDDDDVREGNIWTVLPSGVTIVTVDETYAEGTFIGDTVGVLFLRDQDHPLSAGAWTFRGGRLKSFSFETGESEFRREYKGLGAGRERPGLISIGLNPRISSIPLLLDQERGTVSVAIGRNSFYGGRTRTPHFTAYQSLRGASVAIDGTTILDRGVLG